MDKLKQFLEILASVGPMILSLLPETAPFAPLVSQAIAAAEQIPGATGPQKKAIAVSIVQIAAQAGDQAAGRTVVDPATLGSLVSQGIDTTVAAVNLVQAAKAPAVKAA